MSHYLTKQEILRIHEESIRRFGGSEGILNEGNLEAAVARPQSGYYDDCIEEAAALMESLSQNHPFRDGNKRTALASTAIFLRLNGFKLEFDDLAAYNWLNHLYEQGRVNKQEIETWLRNVAKSR